MKASVDTCFEGKEVREHILCALPRHGAKYDNNGGSDSFQNVCALPGSQEKWCEFSYTPYRNHLNEITHVVCIARDISASRQAETLLREHTLYLDQVSDAIMVIGMDQKIYYWNKSAERIYGWKREQVIDKKKIEAIMPNPEKLETILAIMGEVGSWRGEMVHCTKARKEVAVSSIWTLIHTRQNESFILITNTDITEKKLLEQQFLRIQRMEGIGSVASGIAHDLNNVLSALFMSIRLLKPKCTDEKSVQILDLLDNSAKRGVNLVRQILEFARGIEGNELVIPIPQIVSEVREFVQSTFPKSIEMNAKISADLWTVVGNPTQIHQVMLNLCVNARDAMQGGGRLTVTAENFAVHERDRTKVPESLSSGTYVQIQVIDTGVGIPKQLIGKIFDPFFTTKEKGKGTGLGLSTVQTIVKNHGGFMEVKSKPNIGTEFTIYLPATLQVPGQQSTSPNVEKITPPDHSGLIEESNYRDGPRYFR
ncbi:PAS domain-containing sensor histidine kinase [bacterium]|nr:PAS domain-containing sensor histidine kinase [bacterium]